VTTSNEFHPATQWVADNASRLGYSAVEVQITRRVLSRICPTCEAIPGAWCSTRSGIVLNRLDDQHVTRRAIWRRLRNRK